jgi:hypothetical protein
LLRRQSSHSFDSFKPFEKANGNRSGNMTKFLFSLLAIAALAGAIYWNWKQAAIIQQQQKQISQLGQELRSNHGSTSPDINVQEKCARQAALALKEAGLEHNEKATYTNHFNQKLNKCFVEISWMEVLGGVIYTHKVLSDAYEGRTYGAYDWHTEKDKKYWEVAPYSCVMFPDGKDSSMQTCNSEAQFDQFVQQYLEN